MSALEDVGLIEILREKYKYYAPMYQFLKSVSDEYISKGDIADEC